MTDPGRIDRDGASSLGWMTPQPGQVVRPDGRRIRMLRCWRRQAPQMLRSRMQMVQSAERSEWTKHEVQMRIENEMKQAPRQTLTAPIRRVRFAYVALFFCVWTGLIALRLAWLQVVRHWDFVHRAAMQQQRTFEVAPRRGVLYDRNLRELAMTVLVDSVYAVPIGAGRQSRERGGDAGEDCACRSDGQLYVASSRCWRGSMRRGTLRGWRGGWMRRRRSGCAS